MGDMVLFCWLLCVWELYRLVRWAIVTAWRLLVLAFRGAAWIVRKLYRRRRYRSKPSR